MLSKEDNNYLTRVGPGTPMGSLLRQYWTPVLFSYEVVADGSPERVREHRLVESLEQAFEAGTPLGLEVAIHPTLSLVSGSGGILQPPVG